MQLMQNCSLCNKKIEKLGNKTNIRLTPGTREMPFGALDRDNFTKYVVCPKCTACYEYSECVCDVDMVHML